MSSWDEILIEFGQTPNQADYVRRKYIKNLSDLTGRNTIIYYSGWLQNDGSNLDINDSDMNGFMTTINGLDCSKGLDLILHTPGGCPTAAEAIVTYLKSKFDNDIRVIVPQLALSAGTMVACSGKSILMGKQSSLGPIDPQFSGIAAYNIVNEFQEAEKDLTNHPEKAPYWTIKLQQYPAAFLKTCIDAIQLSSSLVVTWLGDNMYENDPNKDTIINNIAHTLNSRESYGHARHFSSKKCKEIGLKIEDLEDNQELQDAVLSVHHATIITLQNFPVSKIIENNEGKSYIITRNQ